LAGAAFLAAVAVLPNFVTEGQGMTTQMRYFLGGTSVLIVVGVALELVDKLNSQLVMRQYEGGEEGSSGGKSGGRSTSWTSKEGS
jgi:preprotein translocase subunit SecY